MPIAETLAVAAATKVIDRASPTIMDALSSRIGSSVARMKVQFTKTFQAHLTSSLRRSQRVKTIASKDKAISLSKLYVPLTLRSGDDKNIKDVDLDPSLEQGRRYVISGTGGAGKTILMKYLLTKATNNRLGLVPLFFEFRGLNFEDGKSLEQSLFEDLKSSGAGESRTLFEAGLDDGLFVIFLDGFDEVRPEWQGAALQGIEMFSRIYPNVSVIISSRPKTGAQNLTEFDVYHLNRLDKDQALQVVKNTPFNEETKGKFLKELEDSLYDKHKTLMSIPILIVMMLLTFRSYSDIPDRMTVFYAQAFDTLYAIHDSENKLQFKRRHRSNLAPDLFRNILEAFCYLSLKNHDIEFTHNSYLDYVGKAIKLTGADVKPQDYADDLIQNVCILQPDGISFVFVHRSFQEYFASCFALNYAGESKFEIIDKVILSGRGSATSSMMDEINTSKFRRVWLAPKLENLAKTLVAYKDRHLWERMLLYSARVCYIEDHISSIAFGQNSLFGDFDAVQLFSRRAIGFANFMGEMALSSVDYENLIRICESGARCFDVESIKNIDDPQVRYCVTMAPDAEEWLQTTNVKAILDKHLADVSYEAAEVRKYVESQDKLEGELLGLI